MAPCKAAPPNWYSELVYTAPLAYFISFRTYGSWLHGDERRSVDRTHNQFGTPMLARSDGRAEFESKELKHDPVSLSPAARAIVESAIHGVCEHRGWTVHAINVRTNHVHVVVSASGPPEPAMNAFKSWATRRLRESALVGPDTRVWSRHGSTVYLFREDKVAEQVKYVTEAQ